MKLPVAVAALAVLVLGAGAGACDKQGGPASDPQPSAGRVTAPPTTTATTPVANAQNDRPRIDPRCFDVYADCPATRGLPAISADGQRVAVPDLGPEDARDEFVLTMRILDVDTGEQITRAALLTREDRKRWADQGTGELAERSRPELHRRVQAFEHTLTEGRFGPLASLGTVHEQRASDTVEGLRATFNGVELVILDMGEMGDMGDTGNTGASADSATITWRRTISQTPPASVTQCGPLPVADIALWVSREHRVALARVAHMTSESCDLGPFYLVSRI